jgi:hypothetical protein
MKLLFRFHFALASLALAVPIAMAQTTQPQVALTSTGAGTWQAAWAGVTQRTYFMQRSNNLVDWQYAPVIEYGTGTKSFSLTTQGLNKHFLRLQYTDVPGINTLQQAKDADFDNDGLSNLREVSELQNPPSPFLADGDGYEPRTWVTS